MKVGDLVQLTDMVEYRALGVIVEFVPCVADDFSGYACDVYHVSLVDGNGTYPFKPENFEVISESR